MNATFLRSATIVASTLLFATAIPLLSRSAQIGSIEAAVKEAAVQTLPRPKDADGVVVTTVETLPEALTGIRLTGNKVVVQRANGKTFTIEADPDDLVKLANGVTRSATASSGSSAENVIQLEIFKWAALALVILSVANAFLRAVINARKAFGRRAVAVRGGEQECAASEPLNRATLPSAPIV